MISRRDIEQLNFSDLVQFYMEQKGISIEELATKCGISAYLIRKVLIPSFALDGMIPYRLPIVLGIGLGMEPSSIHDLLDAAGFKVPDNDDPYHQVLLRIINMPYPKTVASCNAIMEQSINRKLTDFDIFIPHELNKYRRKVK